MEALIQGVVVFIKTNKTLIIQISIQVCILAEKIVAEEVNIAFTLWSWNEGFGLNYGWIIWVLLGQRRTAPKLRKIIAIKTAYNLRIGKISYCRNENIYFEKCGTSIF